MKPYAKNNPSDVSPEKIIYHFPGGPGKYDSKISKMNVFWEKISELRFITLSNSGYIKFTLNCLESLKRIGFPSQLLHSYVIGKEGYNILKNNGYKCSLIDDEANSNFQTFRNGNWGDITFNKFKIIYPLITIINASSIIVTVLIGKLKTAPKQAHCIFLLSNTDCKTPIILILMTTNVQAFVTKGL